MFYLLYLACLFLWIFFMSTLNAVGGVLCFVPSQIANFFDVAGIAGIGIPCVLVLFCIKSVRALGRAILSMFRRQTAVDRDSLHAVGTVMATSVLAGFICMLIGIINSVREMTLTGGEAFRPEIGIAVSLLPALYSLLLCVILLPVLLSVWKQVRATKLVRPQKAGNAK